ncbi:MAG: phytanoyl-CoA dioxygenase family protein, partial [Chloroflexi bacterium]|nr:phytanoyl-CoA dioxygenase family protein [Chloroflexota bacterium]
MNEFTISNALLNSPAELRQRAAEEGYLFFRGLVEVGAILEVRRDILELCATAGWLAPGTDPMDGIARLEAACVEPQPPFMAVYNQVMKLESFHALAQQPAIIEMLEALFGERVLAHPRNIARIIFPQVVEFTTPSHQDYIHIQGTPETWTAWFPLGDCPRELGSLAVLAGSHRDGIYPTHPAAGAGGLGVETESLPFNWVASDFQCGDILLFQSHTVHRGLP